MGMIFVWSQTPSKPLPARGLSLYKGRRYRRVWAAGLGGTVSDLAFCPGALPVPPLGGGQGPVPAPDRGGLRAFWGVPPGSRQSVSHEDWLCRGRRCTGAL